MRTIVRSGMVALALAASVAACGWAPVPTPVPADGGPPVGVREVAGPEAMRLEVVNGSTIGVHVTVNAVPIGAVSAGEGSGWSAEELPALPWLVQLRTRRGRLLLQMAVQPGDVWLLRNADGSWEGHSDAASVVLSCGRLDVDTGIMTEDQTPPPGGTPSPGDCGP